MYEFLPQFAKDFLLGGPTFNLVTFIFTAISIIAIPASFILGFKAIKNRRPRYLIRNTNLVRDSVQSFEEVSVMYENKKVPNLSVAKVAFWNAGRETIDRNDIVERDSVQIKVAENLQILSVKVLSQNEITNNFTVTLNSRKRFATIGFDYIDKDQGVVLQVLHTGLTEDDVSLSGSIKGCGRLKKIEDRPWLVAILDRLRIRNRLKKQSEKRIVGALMIFSVLGIWYSVIFGQQEQIISNSLSRYVLLLIVTAVYLPIGWSLLRQIVPRGLRLFYE